MAENKPSKSLTYADAGVSIDAGDALIDKIKPLARSTRRPGAEVALGGFGGAFDLKIDFRHGRRRNKTPHCH